MSQINEEKCWFLPQFFVAISTYSAVNLIDNPKALASKAKLDN